ncbi:MAG: DnaJ-domain-containing protein [Monoraphidium minutum]|nr:MAG: DnaJ-domain-containing protein [Monoraphidium minutum]
MAQAAAAAAAAEEEVDPLDAFMSAEVLPEVKARQEAEAAAKQAERVKLAQAMAAGKGPKLPSVLEDSDDEEVPDLEIQVPTSRVKRIVGAGGATIKEIQKKSKARIQIKKSEEELNRGFGGPARPMTTLMLFGDAKAIEIAMRMIDEAQENKEQKAKQRAKEYERKKDQKRRDRQLYHLRHARDYEELGVPIGACKLDVKKAYRKLAILWHPDKHPEDAEAAKAKFQSISAAYNSLMASSEDDRVEQLEGK